MIRSIFSLIIFSLPFIGVNGQRNMSMNSSSSAYYNVTEAYVARGVSYVTSPFSSSTVGLSIINGFKLDNNFRIGIGVGYYAYNGGGLIPAYLDLRYFFKTAALSYRQIQEGKSKPAFFIYGDGGYLVNMQDLNHGTRMMVNPGIGFVKPFSENMSGSFSIGIVTQMGDNLPRASFVNAKIGLMFR